MIKIFKYFLLVTILMLVFNFSLKAQRCTVLENLTPWTSDYDVNEIDACNVVGFYQSTLDPNNNYYMEYIAVYRNWTNCSGYVIHDNSGISNMNGPDALVHYFGSAHLSLGSYFSINVQLDHHVYFSPGSDPSICEEFN
jgi:hypothetical protein